MPALDCLRNMATLGYLTNMAALGYLTNMVALGLRNLYRVGGLGWLTKVRGCHKDWGPARGLCEGHWLRWANPTRYKVKVPILTWPNCSINIWLLPCKNSGHLMQTRQNSLVWSNQAPLAVLEYLTNMAALGYLTNMAALHVMSRYKKLVKYDLSGRRETNSFWAWPGSAISINDEVFRLWYVVMIS